MSETKDYKVLKVSIKNFKNIESMDLDLKGRSVFIIGENAQNKTSTIQAIWTALSNKGIPKAPVKKGEKESNIIVVVGSGGREYTIERVFKENGDSKLEITSPDGFKTTKIANLETLIGDINFDIGHFVSLTDSVPGRREQVKIVREYLSMDENERLNTIDADIKTVEAERTDINSNIKRLKIEIDTFQTKSGLSESDYEKYSEKINTEELMNDVKNGQSVNKRIDDSERELKYHEQEISKLAESIKGLMKQQIEREQKRDAIKAELKNAVRVDLDAVNEKIRSAATHNEVVDKIIANRESVNILNKAERKYKELAEARELLRKAKTEIFSTSKLPVDGLTFDEDGLYINGIPLAQDQQSTSELIEIGVKLAIAKNPQCHIVRIDRAESLGNDKLKSILEICAKHNYQAFFEEVRRGAENLKVEFVE